MTAKEIADQERRFYEKLIVKDIPLERAAKTVVAAQATRIFVEGKNSSDGNIGQYDTKTPLYVNPNKAPRKTADKVKGIEGLLPTRGKHGDTKFKSGKAHKTTYVNNYKDLRNRIGRPIDRVNLTYSGDLKSDFSNSKSTAVPVKINEHEYVTGLKRDSNIEKLAGLEKKYGEVTGLTKREENLFFDVAAKEFKLLTL